MFWLFDFFAEWLADLFGARAGRDRPWWVEWLASLGCLTMLLLPAGAIWLLVR